MATILFACYCVVIDNGQKGLLLTVINGFQNNARKTIEQPVQYTGSMNFFMRDINSRELNSFI